MQGSVRPALQAADPPDGAVSAASVARLCLHRGVATPCRRTGTVRSLAGTNMASRFCSVFDSHHRGLDSESAWPVTRVSAPPDSRGTSHRDAGSASLRSRRCTRKCPRRRPQPETATMPICSPLRSLDRAPPYRPRYGGRRHHRADSKSHQRDGNCVEHAHVQRSRTCKLARTPWRSEINHEKLPHPRLSHAQCDALCASTAPAAADSYVEVGSSPSQRSRRRPANARDAELLRKYGMPTNGMPVLGDITGITATPAVTPGKSRLITKKAGHKVTGLDL